MRKMTKRLGIGLIALSVLISNFLGSLIPAEASIVRDFVLTASPNAQENYIQLNWTNPFDQPGTYRVYRKGTDGTWESIPSKATVKVLNIYPDNSNGYTTITNKGLSEGQVDLEGKPVPDSGILKTWLLKENIDEVTIEAVSLSDFNANPSKYLNENNGLWNYDAVFYGMWNLNPQILYPNDTAIEHLRTFINDGGGFMTSHHTVGYMGLDRGVNKLAEELGVEIFSNQPHDWPYREYVGQYPDGTLFPTVSFIMLDGASRDRSSFWPTGNQVKIVKKGFLTEYPFKVGEIGQIYDIPSQHGLNVFAKGDVWMETVNPTGFVGMPFQEITKSPATGQTGTNNFYVHTHNNTAIINSGHSFPSITQAETRIIANTLFYLSQITTEQSWQERVGMDVTPPTKPVGTIEYKNGIVSWSLLSQDKGVVSEYKVEAKQGSNKIESQPVTAELKSGLAGYSVVVDNLPNTKPDSTIESSQEASQIDTTGKSSFYVHVSAVDKGGNVSEPIHFYYEDGVKPTMNYSQSVNEPTNKDVTLTVSADDSLSGLSDIQLPNGTWVKQKTVTYVAPTNGTYQFKARDNAGNVETLDVKVTNIDKTPPSNATFTSSNPSPTNQDVTVTVNYPSDSIVKQYKIGLTGTWNPYVNPIVFSSNQTIYARSYDALGNLSSESSYAVNNIDKVAPNQPSISADVTAPTNGNVSLTVTYPSDASVKEYRLNGGTWISYSSSVTMTSNGKLEARAMDQAGNISAISSYTVTNIDKTAPADATMTASTTSATNQDVTVTITYPSDATIKQVKIGSSGLWIPYTAPVKLSENMIVYARSYDNAGNLSSETSYAVSNIDKTAPTAPIISSSETLPTNQDVSVSIISATDGVKTEYRIDQGNWNSYSEPLKLTRNALIEARTSDEAGNVSPLSSYQANNIDKLPPESPKLSILENQNSVEMEGDGDSKLFYRLNNQYWMEYSSRVSLEDGNYEIDLKAIDQAGNESPTTSASAVLYGTRLSNAVMQVEKAEGNVTQENVNLAHQKVDAVPHEKPEYLPLLKRVNDLQALLDVRKALDTAIETKNETDVALAKEKISLLNQSSPIIIDFMVVIEDDFKKADILSLVAKERYDVLSSKYQMSKPSYDALVQMYYAIKYTGDFMYKQAKEKTALVPESDKYYGLVQEQLQNLNDDYNQFVAERVATDAEIKAESSVQVMEKTYDPSLAVNTQNLINAVEDSTVRQSLQARLDNAKAKYEASLLAKADQDAVSAVEKAESTKQSYYVTEAYKKVNYLTNAELKFQLTNRLQILEAKIALERQIADATRTVELAEQYKYQSYIDSAQKKITALPNVAEKTSLQLRLDAVKSGVATSDQATIIKQATNYLSLAQSIKTQYYVDKAQGYINQILDATKKAELQGKLDAIVIVG